MRNQWELIHGVFKLLSRAQKKQALVLLVMIICSAGLEAIGIGIILPLLNAVSSPETVSDSMIFLYFQSVFGSLEYGDFILLLTASIIILFLVKNIFLGYLAYLQAMFSVSVYVSLSRRLLETYLTMPYTRLALRNSSEMIRTSTTDAYSVTQSVIAPVQIIVSEIFVGIAICLTLLIIDPVITLVVVGLIGVGAVFIHLGIRQPTIRYGALRHRHQAGVIKWISQSLGAVKDIKVLHREEFFFRAFLKEAKLFGVSSSLSGVLAVIPRLGLETIVVISVLSTMAILVHLGRSGPDLIPVLGVLGAAAIRLMPSASRILTAVHRFVAFLPALEAIKQDLAFWNEEQSKFLDKEQQATQALSDKFDRFEDSIELRNVSHAYDGVGMPALKNISLEIKFGQSVGIVGPSGAGKSTLINILLGLIVPTQGEMLIDGKSTEVNCVKRRLNLGYIPQDIYLLDDTIQNNILFGADFDEKKMKYAISAAHLDEFVDKQASGRDEMIGEQGARISGGQRQRIAIARALYNAPDVLFLDEATASLDNKTEREVSQTIRNLNGKITTITVAHRLTTVRHCDVLFFIKDGLLLSSGTYDELSINSPDFLAMSKPN